MSYRPAHVLIFLAAWVADAQAPPESEKPQDEPAIFGTPSAFDLSAGEETVWLPADTELHREPAPRAGRVALIGADAELPVLERDGGWVRVRYGSYNGWVIVDPELVGEAAGDSMAEPADWSPSPSRFLAEHLEHARGFLAGHPASRRMGGFDVYTDLEAERRLADFGRLFASLPFSFEQRFGVSAILGDGAAAVLYADASAYERYAEAMDGLPGLVGHTLGSVAVLPLEQRHDAESRTVLVHELTHVITHFALGPQLPPWLVEGLAEDLAYCRVGAQGELILGSLDSWSSSRTLEISVGPNRRARTSVFASGGPALNLDALLEKWSTPERPALRSLVEMPWAELMAVDRRRIHYTMSAFWVRFLLADEDLATRFQAFLAAVARGEKADAAALERHLDRDWDELEAALERWIHSREARRGRR